MSKKTEKAVAAEFAAKKEKKAKHKTKGTAKVAPRPKAGSAECPPAHRRIYCPAQLVAFHCEASVSNFGERVQASVFVEFHCSFVIPTTLLRSAPLKSASFKSA